MMFERDRVESEHVMMAGLLDGVILLAQAGGDSNTWSSLALLLPIPFLFYFLIILPQQKQEKTRRAMIDSLKKNDKVLTSGGIYGTVVSVDGGNDRVVLRVDDDKGTKISFTRSSVARVIEQTDKPADAS